MEETLIQWHPAFVAAMGLELAENRNDLFFDREHNLNKKPLEVDLLIIKKEGSEQIKNEIGHLFKTHNLIEYKAPGDQLNIDVFYKVLGYACLYKAYGESVNSRVAKEITITIVRDQKPEGMFRYFSEQNIPISRPYPGIYYVDGISLFSTQIVVTRELNLEEHIVLKALAKNAGEDVMRGLFGYARQLHEKWNRELMDSVLEVSIRANEDLVKAWRRDEIMCQALLEIMEPEIKEREKRATENGIYVGREKGREEGIINLITSLRELGIDTAGIREMVSKRYPLTEAELTNYLAK